MNRGFLTATACATLVAAATACGSSSGGASGSGASGTSSHASSGATSTSTVGAGGSGNGSSSSEASSGSSSGGEPGGLAVITAVSTAVVDGFVSQSVDCPVGKVAVAGGARFTDATSADRDGMLMMSAPSGNPPSGWMAAGSTQYSTTGGKGNGDRIEVYAVCADAGSSNPEVVTSMSAAVVNGLVSQAIACPSGKLTLGGGARFTDATGVDRDGMLMNIAPVGNPASGWANTGSTQYSTKGGQGTGDRVEAYAVCADVGSSNLAVVTSMSAAVVNGFVSQSVACPSGTLAVGGGSGFTDAGGVVRDGMLMNSAPVGNPASGWAVSGSTQYSTTGGQGNGDRITVYAVCAATL